MTSIATKNGSIIVKDGSVAEGCECCTPDEWKCCALYFAPIASLKNCIKSVSVTIDGSSSDLSKTLKQTWTNMQASSSTFCPTYYTYRQILVPMSSFAGTHSLSITEENITESQPNGYVKWSKSIVDDAGCAGGVWLRLERSNQGVLWLLQIDYPLYRIQLGTQSGNENFKTVSEMTCSGSDINSINNECFGSPRYRQETFLLAYNKQEYVHCWSPPLSGSMTFSPASGSGLFFSGNTPDVSGSEECSVTFEASA